MARRFEQIRKKDDHYLYGAEAFGELQAFMHAYYRPALERPTAIVVKAIIVDPTYRNRGIGRSLLAHCDKLGNQYEAREVTLHSRIDRVETAKFYFHVGFQRDAESATWRRRMTDKRTQFLLE